MSKSTSLPFASSPHCSPITLFPGTCNRLRNESATYSTHLGGVPQPVSLFARTGPGQPGSQKRGQELEKPAAQRLASCSCSLLVLAPRVSQLARRVIRPLTPGRTAGSIRTSPWRWRWPRYSCRAAQTRGFPRLRRAVPAWLDRVPGARGRSTSSVRGRNEKWYRHFELVVCSSPTT